MNARPLGWPGIFRLGLVQAALGAVVVLVTSTVNRVMVVEYALPALLPGVLVALHYVVQLIRPRFGYGSDRGNRRTPWIIGGMAVLGVGGVLCACAAVSMPRHFAWGVMLAVIAYGAVGVGVGAAGTSLLALMAKRVDARRRAAAATIMWIMMIAGFAVTSTVVGHFLDPFSAPRLLKVTAMAAAAAFLIALTAVWKVEQSGGSDPRGGDAPGEGDAAPASVPGTARAGGFGPALRRAWSDPQSRRFTLFVFVSMLAYSAQELLLEPFSGLVFGYSLGDSTKLSGSWHAASLAGMLCVGLLCSGVRRAGTLRFWTIGGCCASAIALASMAAAAVMGPGWPLRASVLALGLGNGVFAVAAISSMMELAQRGEAGSAGTRMGLWGAAQALGFALGGVCATGIVDLCRSLLNSPTAAFAIVFSVEAALFFVAARLAARVESEAKENSPSSSNATVVLA
jgi:BCD family chlorophyll transporter-like MFS transporter